jgi:IS1 family transposase
VDELKTFLKKWGICLGNKCLLQRNKKIVRFCVGSRTNKTLNRVLLSLRLIEAKKIYTDKLKNYLYLIDG